MPSKFALIIEDHRDIGTIYSEALQSAHFQTEHILDGKEALDRLKQVTPDLVILDMNLPRVSGHYIFKQIRSDQRLSQTHIIIATANTPMAEALQPELSEYDMILIKPISPSQLRDLALRLK